MKYSVSLLCLLAFASTSKSAPFTFGGAFTPMPPCAVFHTCIGEGGNPFDMGLPVGTPRGTYFEWHTNVLAAFVPGDPVPQIAGITRVGNGQIVFNTFPSFLPALTFVEMDLSLFDAGVFTGETGSTFFGYIHTPNFSPVLGAPINNDILFWPFFLGGVIPAWSIPEGLALNLPVGAIRLSVDVASFGPASIFETGASVPLTDLTQQFNGAVDPVTGLWIPELPFDGHDLIIPEPGTWVFFVVGGAAIGFRRYFASRTQR